MELPFNSNEQNENERNVYVVWQLFLCSAKIYGYESAVRVVFGSSKLISPPPANRMATINVGAGQ